MTTGDPLKGFDPWTAPLSEVGEKYRAARSRATSGTPALDPYGLHEGAADYLRQVLQARAVLDAAETNRSLVHATWVTVALTAVLAIAAVVALFLGG